MRYVNLLVFITDRETVVSHKNETNKLCSIDLLFLVMWNIAKMGHIFLPFVLFFVLYLFSWLFSLGMQASSFFSLSFFSGVEGGGRRPSTAV